MTPKQVRWSIVAVGPLLFLLMAGGWWLARSGDDRATALEREPLAQAQPAPSPEPTYQLKVELGRVRGLPEAERIRPRHLENPAQAVRAVMTAVYEVGFVDPAGWAGGRFPSLFGYLSGEAREEARRDLEDLTLGRAAAQLFAVRPERARLDISFLVDSRGRPIAAFADMEFTGVGLGEDFEIPLRHEGDYTLRREGGLWRIVAYDVRGRVPSPGDIRRATREARFSPGVPSRDLLFVLAIGSDARPGHSETRALADSLHIIGVNPAKGIASIVGIPRDSFVPIPGVGSGKINEALFRGGPELVVRTVESLSGIPIDAYVLTGFEGFRSMVDAVGRVEIRVPYPMHDPYSKADFGVGSTWLSGREALSFSRNRHDAPGGDFGRSLNQGRLIIAALAQLRSDVRDDPLALLRWLAAGARYLRTDLSLAQLVELFMAVPSIDPGRVRNWVVPGTVGTVGGRSIVRLSAEAHAIFRDLARDAVLGARR